MWIDDKEILIRTGLIKTAELAPECYNSTINPEVIIDKLRRENVKADIFVFSQRIPENQPKYNYHMEWMGFAVINIISYDHWLEKQITRETRKNINRASKKGIVVKIADFNDDFVNGIINIYNESPVRQGKPFRHYKKDFITIKKEHSTYLENCIFIGAYYNGELVGFIQMFYSGKCASTLQVISKIEHRDKKPTNALLSKAIEICHQKNIRYFQYGEWSKGTLGDFKRYNGFEEILMPVYYIPLNIKGKIIIKMKLYRGFASIVPDIILRRILDIRAKWYSR